MRDVVAARRRRKPQNRFAVPSKYSAVAETTGGRSSVFSRSSNANRLSSSASNARAAQRKPNVGRETHDSSHRANA